MPDEPVEGPPPRPGDPRAVHSAEVFCDNCQRPTSHRILRLDPPATRGIVGTLQGLARCRECRLTHRFRTEAVRPIEVDLVVSEGPRSTPRRLELAPRLQVRVGEDVPGQTERLRVLRIDRTDDRSVDAAWSEEIRTVWATPSAGARVPVSIVEGRRTRSLKVPFPPELRLEVAGHVRIEDRDYDVSAVRARGHTWRDLGDGFSAREVERLYVRRTFTPPAGRRDWIRDRGSPSSPESETSTSARSRSSPGTIRTRTRPRARSAAGGAAHQSSEPW